MACTRDPPSSSLNAYATLITRPSYLAGVVVLAHTLRRHRSPHPFVVLYTSSLPHSCVDVLQAEATRLHLILKPVSSLRPDPRIKIDLIAERFADTWTKLRVFELFEFERVCYLDADMTIRRNMDEIFSLPLPSTDWIAANHACVCNLDGDPWAPADWTVDNCAYSDLAHPSALTRPTEVSPDSRPTHHLLNSGMFLFCPSAALWGAMMRFFGRDAKLGEYMFPDQDFLADFFRNRWKAVGWQYNAIKTMRYWHGEMWRDDEVRCLHYIVDKPWAQRVARDGSAGYLGKDGETHAWWWADYTEWESSRLALGESAQVEAVRRHIAKPLDAEGRQVENDELKAIGSAVQAFANNEAHLNMPGGVSVREVSVGDE